MERVRYLTYGENTKVLLSNIMHPKKSTFLVNVFLTLNSNLKSVLGGRSDFLSYRE